MSVAIPKVARGLAHRSELLGRHLFGLDLRLDERDDRIELGRDLPPAHPEDGTVQEDVLPACQLGMEPGPDLEQ